MDLAGVAWRYGTSFVLRYCIRVHSFNFAISSFAVDN